MPGSLEKVYVSLLPTAKHHNPYVDGGMEALTEAMIMANKEMGPQFPDPEFAVKHILADREFVAVHTELLGSKSKPNDGGLGQVHLFRFDGDKIVEYWDIINR